MKKGQIKFNLYGRTKTILRSEDWSNAIIGLAFILAGAMGLGIFEFFTLNIEPGDYLRIDYWISYFTKLMTLYLAFTGAYIYRKAYKLKQPQVLIQRETLRENRKLISESFKTNDCENWLREVYNRGIKLNMFEQELVHENSKIVLIEPIKEEKANWLQRLIYKKRLKKYNKGKEKRKFIEEQLDLIETHRQAIELFKRRKDKEARELLKSIDDVDTFKRYKPRYEEITFKKLFNVDSENKRRENPSDAFDYNERGVILRKIGSTLMFGCLIVPIINSIILTVEKDAIEQIAYFFINLVLLLWYVWGGIKVANNFVDGNVVAVDSVKIDVCNKYRDDSIIIGEDWAREMKSLTIQADKD